MHIPVLLTETLDGLSIRPGEIYIDGTFGRGGHTREILNKGGKVVAFDWDPDAQKSAQQNFAKEIADGSLVIIPENFAEITSALLAANYTPASFAGALFDLGMSSNQIDESGRGFTFNKEEPLDMRMDPKMGVTAADLLNALPEKHLKTLFWENAQETDASRIAQAIVQRRLEQPFKTTTELAEVVSKMKRRHDRHIHPATKVFQALRIAVNLENENLEGLLKEVSRWIEPKGRLTIISFHEGEDRQVKHAFQDWEAQGKGSQVTKKPVMVTDTERDTNPRSRSARLRIFEYV